MALGPESLDRGGLLQQHEQPTDDPIAALCKERGVPRDAIIALDVHSDQHLLLAELLRAREQHGVALLTVPRYPAPTERASMDLLVKAIASAGWVAEDEGELPDGAWLDLSLHDLTQERLEVLLKPRHEPVMFTHNPNWRPDNRHERRAAKHRRRKG